MALRCNHLKDETTLALTVIQPVAGLQYLGQRKLLFRFAKDGTFGARTSAVARAPYAQTDSQNATC